jgi:hypothetical protein
MVCPLLHLCRAASSWTYPGTQLATLLGWNLNFLTALLEMLLETMLALASLSR